MLCFSNKVSPKLFKILQNSLLLIFKILINFFHLPLHGGDRWVFFIPLQWSFFPRMPIWLTPKWPQIRLKSKSRLSALICIKPKLSESDWTCFGVLRDFVFSWWGTTHRYAIRFYSAQLSPTASAKLPTS
jgi:hypothetical protein